MTLAAPKSRRGKLSLALAFVAALMAVAGAFLWANSAQATMPSTIVTLSQSPATPGPVNPGQLITYTMVTSTSGPNTLGQVVMTVTVGAGVQGATITTTCPTPAGGVAWAASAVGVNPATCTSAAVLTSLLSNYTMTVTALAGVSGTVAAPGAASVGDTNGTCATCFATRAASVGPLTITGVSIDPPNPSTNLIGQPHTFVWRLPPGFTCNSDKNFDGLVQCTASDVTSCSPLLCTPSNVGTTGATIGAPVVTTPPGLLTNTNLVSITISGATAAGTATITLNTAFGDGSAPFGLGPDTPDVTATKIYTNLAGVGGAALRHVDVDCGTERAAGSGGSDYGSNGLQCNGLLSNGNVFTGNLTVSGFALDDNDDATGSLHTVCILGNITSADNANINWTITPTAGSSATVNNLAKVGLDVSGNTNLEPCVQWRSGGTGGQTITATYVPTGEVIYSNGIDAGSGQCPGAPKTLQPCAPLIKQWNTIDSTKLVLASGDVGTILANNNKDLASWTGLAAGASCVRDDNFSTLDVNCVDRANHSGETITVTGTLITGPVGFGRVNAAGISFIDYALGSHKDYNGPVDGVQQTYTVTGDCGSVRLEDPVTGNAIRLSPAGTGSSNAAAATILGSDKGVGFEVVPNRDGNIQTTAFNSNCDPSSHLKVTISSREEVQLNSVLDTAPDESIDIHWTVGPPTNKQPLLAWAGQRVVLEYDWSVRTPSAAAVAIVSSSVANPTVITTSAAHGLSTGDSVIISGHTGSAPNINGTWVVTVTGATTFTIPANVTVAGAGGTVTRVVRQCPWAGGEQRGFQVRYAKQSGSGALVSDLGSGVASGPDYMVVGVSAFGDSNVQPNADCISRVIYESQDQSEVDVIAHVVRCEFIFCQVISQQVPFLVYYMKLEDVKLSLVPGARAGHNSGLFTANSNPILDVKNDSIPTTGDVQTLTANVSADVLARVRVRGWVMKDNCPVRAQGTDSNGSALPANRCIFPDDWRHLAGGSLAEELRPNYDIWGGAACGSNNAGPFSLLDGPACGDSRAPLVTVPYLPGNFRETNFPNGTTPATAVVNAGDGSMPPSLIRLLLSGTGFIRPADKTTIYYGTNANQYYVTHIPAEPWITPINQDLSGYQWNTWGVGSKSGLYDFWTDLADSGTPVVSCPGASSPGCAGGVATGGYNMIKIYSDNHGEAMAWLNGDANVDFTKCISSAPATTAGGSKIVLISGFYCDKDVTVGTATLKAAADYPDKRKHEPLASNDVTVTWTWGGTKEVKTVTSPGNQFAYVVLSVTDRDGFCGALKPGATPSVNPTVSPSLHPVLYERVDFLIDSTDGIITPDAKGNAAEGPAVTNLTAKTATTHTFDTKWQANINAGIVIAPKAVDNECQAWIYITSSLLRSVNVLVTAYDPEGTVTFDVTYNNATPTPVPTAPPPTASPVPPFLWGDIDCNGDASSVDSLKTLQSVAHLPFDQVGPCFAVGSSVTVNGTARKFGDVNCDGSVNSVDSLDILLFVASLPGLPGGSGCPHVGDHVNISSP